MGFRRSGQRVVLSGARRVARALGVAAARGLDDQRRGLVRTQAVHGDKAGPVDVRESVVDHWGVCPVGVEVADLNGVAAVASGGASERRVQSCARGPRGPGPCNLEAVDLGVVGNPRRAVWGWVVAVLVEISENRDCGVGDSVALLQ